MSFIFGNKNWFLSFALVLLSGQALNAVNAYVINLTSMVGFRIGLAGNVQGYKTVSWDSNLGGGGFRGLPGGKLTRAMGIQLVLSCCQNERTWNSLTLYITNKNSANKQIDIPLYIPGHAFPSPIIIFKKNAAEQIEVHVANYNGGNFIDDSYVATLEPQDYE